MSGPNKSSDTNNKTTFESSLFKTPLRDEMRINMEDSLSNIWENQSTANNLYKTTNSLVKVNSKT